MVSLNKKKVWIIYLSIDSKRFFGKEGEFIMRIGLNINPVDLEKMKMIYTSYLPDPGELTEVEAEAVLMFCLDRAVAQMNSRKRALELELICK